MQIMTLKEYLSITGTSMVDFASRVSTTPATISRIADGTVMPRRALMQRIFAATGGTVTPNDLTGLHGPAGPDDGLSNPSKENIS